MLLVQRKKYSRDHPMEVFDSKPPAYSAELLAKITKDFFGKSGTIKPLVSERDQNARIITEDGDYVFTHTEYDFFGPKAGFDVFRFENGLIVEHWDNLLEVQPANPSGRTQFDGVTEIKDLDKTEANKATVKGFIDDVLLNHQNDKITTYINPTKYLQHNPADLEYINEELEYLIDIEDRMLNSSHLYQQLHDLRRQNQVRLGALYRYERAMRNIIECDTTDCDIYYLNNHEKNRNSYIQHKRKYRELKTKVLSMILLNAKR